WRNIFDCFQVIGIRAPGRIPFCSLNCSSGIIHHLLRCSSCAVILPDGLLCKDWREFRAAYCGNMARCSESESVTKAKGWREEKRHEHIEFRFSGESIMMSTIKTIMN